MNFCVNELNEYFMYSSTFPSVRLFEGLTATQDVVIPSLTCSSTWWYKTLLSTVMSSRFHTFSKCIRSKVNILTWLKCRLNHYGVLHIATTPRRLLSSVLMIVFCLGKIMMHRYRYYIYKTTVYFAFFGPTTIYIYIYTRVIVHCLY